MNNHILQFLISTENCKDQFRLILTSKYQIKRSIQWEYEHKDHTIPPAPGVTATARGQREINGLT